MGFSIPFTGYHPIPGLKNRPKVAGLITCVHLVNLMVFQIKVLFYRTWNLRLNAGISN